MSQARTNRKRKLSEASTSCSSLEDDCPSTEHNEVTKLARSCVEEDSDGDDLDKCPVCLKALHKQTLSITDTCRYHTFCFSCLEEWSKTRNTCPVDRKEYQSILVLDAAGNVTKQVPVEASTERASTSWSLEDEHRLCEVCNSFDDEQSTFICDGCGMGYHLNCLMPLVENIPAGVWLCNDCSYYYNY